MEWSCTSCGANWSTGAFGDSCEECGGGAMERPCIVCGGRCGEISTRAPIDSNDAKVAHWLCRCALPAAEQQSIMRKQVSDKPGG